MNPLSPELRELATQLCGLSRVHYLTCHHPAHGGQVDKTSQCVQDFRNGIEPQTSRWIDLAGELMGGADRFDLIIRALGSDETSPKNGSPLDRLCEAIARKSATHYQPARLTKMRPTRRLQGLGGKAGHKKELSGAFSFDGMGLKIDSHILVVDDTLATGATLEAIGAAIHESLPAAKISGFVLSKAGGSPGANKMDPASFLTAEKRQTTRQPRPKRVPAAPPVKNSSAAKAPKISMRNRRTISITSIFGIVLAVAIIGAILPLHSNTKQTAPDVSIEGLLPPPPDTATAVTQPPEAAPATKAIAEHKNLHPGMVTIPSAGLRLNHSIDARCLRKAVVRLGEKVEIVRKYSADSGPDWIQLRTKNGDVGWVMASVVKELKSSRSL